MVVTSPSLQASPELREQEDLGCVHYWIIDVPAGPVSKGKCRLCGEARDFRNYLESLTGWEDDRVLGQASAQQPDSVSQLVGSIVEAEDGD